MVRAASIGFDDNGMLQYFNQLKNSQMEPEINTETRFFEVQSRLRYRLCLNKLIETVSVTKKVKKGLGGFIIFLSQNNIHRVNFNKENGAYLAIETERREPDLLPQLNKMLL